jgi:HSP20 family protein
MLGYPFGDRYSGVPLREMMDRLFNDAQIMTRARGETSGAALEPPANVYETDADLMVVLPLPGVSPNDIDLELLGTQLCVRTTARRDVPHANVGSDGGDSGEGDRDRRWFQHEFQIGPYERTLELPYVVDADRVHATYEHGLLALRFPRPDADRPRRIPLGLQKTSETPAGSQQTRESAPGRGTTA